LKPVAAIFDLAECMFLNRPNLKQKQASDHERIQIQSVFLHSNHPPQIFFHIPF
jgi:hypothetical protein